MQTLLGDLRFAARSLRRDFSFTVAAVFILALGIGANVTIMSVVNALVFRPLPYPDPERLVFVSEGNERLKIWGAVSYPNFADWKDQNQALESMAIVRPEEANIAGGGEPERVTAVLASKDLIAMLGATPSLGREFLAEEFSPAAPRAVILSNGFWKRRFGANSRIVGQMLNVDGDAHWIVGVLPAGFRLAYLSGVEPEIWLPLRPDAGLRRDSRAFNVIARLKRGISMDRAQADMNAIALRLANLYPDTNSGWKVQVTGLRGTVDPLAYALLALLNLSVLGIVCSNVANLLLARTATREKELAVRAALGAGRWRLARQLFCEGLLVALTGTAAGVLVAYCCCGLIRSGAAGTNLELADVYPDMRVLGAAGLFFIAAVAATVLIPALRYSRINPGQSLKGGTSGIASVHKKRFRTLLIAAEVMLSFILLMGAGIVIKSWFRLWEINPGHRIENILTVSISLAKSRYGEPREQVLFFRNLLGKLQARNDLQAVGIVNALPTWAPRAVFTIPGRVKPQGGEEMTAGHFVANPSYFRTMEIELKGGRPFNEEDTGNAAQVAIVNQAMAGRYWKDLSPLGAEIEAGGTRRTIVGLIADMRSVPLHRKPQPEIWIPFDQAPSANMILAARTRTGNPLTFGPSLKRVLEALDPEQPIARIRTMDQVRMQDMGVILTGTRLLGIVALGALILAAAGIYGVLSYSVSHRTAEFGIRMALGARRADILRLVLREGMTLTALGMAPGLLGALALGKILASSLHGIRPMEPGILAGLGFLLLMVSLLACCVPAWRATRVDPMVALRYQ